MRKKILIKMLPSIPEHTHQTQPPPLPVAQPQRRHRRRPKPRRPHPRNSYLSRAFYTATRNIMLYTNYIALNCWNITERAFCGSIKSL